MSPTFIPGPIPLDAKVTVPDVTEPIYAARSWNIRQQGKKIPGLPERTILMSGYPGRGNTYDWPVGAPQVAKCSTGPFSMYSSTTPAQVTKYQEIHANPSPVEQCSCGIYGVSDPYLLEAYVHEESVVGVMAMWGRVIPAALGWRGQFAQPVAIVSDGDKQSSYIAKLYNIPIYDAWPTLTELREGVVEHR